MEGSCKEEGKKAKAMTKASKSGRTIRRMHSFDRGIKIANQHRNPDLEEQLPSYMRQTCASLVKRAPSKTRERQSIDSQPSTTKNSPRDKGTSKKTRKRISGKAGQTSRSASSCSDGGESSTSIGMRSPWSERLVLAEDQSSVQSLGIKPSHADDSYNTLLESKAEEGHFITDEHLTSALLEECFQQAIQDTATSGRTSPGTPSKTQKKMRGRSISSILTLEDAYSEVAQDESFSFAFDSDGDEDSPRVAEVGQFRFTSAFFQSTSTDLPPASTFTAHSEKITSQTAEDVAKDIEEAEWLARNDDEANEEEGHSEQGGKLESHRLEDFMDSWTDSELGDYDLATDMVEQQDILPAPSRSIISFTRKSSCDSDFDLHLPLSIDTLSLNKDTASYDRRFSKEKSSNESEDSGSFRIQGPSMLWMLGGNVLAGVVGAALASAGVPPLLADLAAPNAAVATENEEIVATPRSDVARADDWFFQASALRADHGE